MRTPYYREQALEGIAREVITAYDPNLYYGVPRMIPIEDIIEAQGITLEYQCLRKTGCVLGETIFDDGGAIIYDYDIPGYTVIAVKGGTISAQENPETGQTPVGGIPGSAAPVHGGGNMTLREYILFWQETYDKHQSRPTTYAAHNYVFKNHILPSLGDIPLSELTSEMVGEFLEERRRFGNHRPGSSGLGEETMRHIHRLLQQCLDQAMRDGLIGDNPARAFHYSKPKKVNADVLTPLEMEDYLDAAERLGHLPMFMLALTAGLRQGELIALKWNDLNVKNRALTISEQRSVERRELIEYGSETRTITLSSELVDLLIMEHAKNPNSPLMFMHPATQRPYSPQMVRRMHNEIIKEAGLDHIRFTDLRHTCAVLSLQNGMETKELARMLGHYRPSITRQNYEPYLPRMAKKEADIPKEATQRELQQAANVLDALLKF